MYTKFNLDYYCSLILQAWVPSVVLLSFCAKPSLSFLEISHPNQKQCQPSKRLCGKGRRGACPRNSERGVNASDWAFPKSLPGHSASRVLFSDLPHSSLSASFLFSLSSFGSFFHFSLSKVIVDSCHCLASSIKHLMLILTRCMTYHCRHDDCT